MKNLYISTNNLDRKCVEKFGLSELILMENAAAKIEILIRKKLKKHSTIIFVCGSGNNGADGITLARRLSGDYKCLIYLVAKEFSGTNALQQTIAQKVGVGFISKLQICDCIVDGIFGSGLNRNLSGEICSLIKKLNSIKALKISVDVPSGIDEFGQIRGAAFKADFTITMGARKVCLYMDSAKDYVGVIINANLGISSKIFEDKTDIFLLEKKDLKLPFRNRQNTNKGDFGHTYVISGKMRGASAIAALSASAIGSGLVSVVSKKKLVKIHPSIMQKKSLKGAKIVVAGCGLGDSELNLNELTEKICVIDADLCYKNDIINLLQNNENLVITPHPKEFSSLLNLAKMGEQSVSETQSHRFELAKKWSLKFKNVLILKGANTIIAHKGNVYIMPYGTSALSKGGSGDVLAGMIGGLLAQGYSPLDAALNGTLAHALAAREFKKNSYALNPLDIIEGLKCLKK